MRTVAVDIETFDPNLKIYGDGSCRESDSPDDDDSCILCVGTYDGQRAKAYRPFTYEWEEFVELMADENTDKVFHNGIYDLAWLVCGYDIEVKGNCHDTMTRMAYIDEYADLDLDSCCKYFKVQGKNKSETIEAWYDLHKEQIFYTAEVLDHKIKKTDDLWKHSLFLWNNWPEFRDKMIEYNLQDCRATYNLYFAQESRMKKVYDAYMVDVRLTPLIIQMKKRGVRIDRQAMSKLTDTIQADLDNKEKVLKDTYGITLEMIASSKQLGKRLNEMGIHSPTITKTGAESWGADSMARLMHYPMIPLITEVKGYKKLLDTYMYGGMANAILSDGRIHCTFSPNKREDGGTVRVKVVDDKGEELFGNGTGFQRMKQLAIVMSIISSKENNQSFDYPFISDAPFSEFGIKFINNFLDIAPKVFRQSIIMIKDLYDPDSEQLILPGGLEIAKRMQRNELDGTFYVNYVEEKADSSNLVTKKKCYSE